MNPQIAIDFTRAQERAEAGIESSAAHANRVESEWTGQALGMLCAIGAELSDFTVEEVREIAEARGLPLPPDRRAWGAVTRRALHKKRMVPTGERRRAKTSNGSKKDVYRLVLRTA
jgi:hypothetical protein